MNPDSSSGWSPESDRMCRRDKLSLSPWTKPVSVGTPGYSSLDLQEKTFFFRKEGKLSLEKSGRVGLEYVTRFTK